MGVRNMAAFWMAGTALAVCWSAPGFAQGVSGSPQSTGVPAEKSGTMGQPDRTAPPEEAASGTSTDQAEAGRIVDIVVTAQRRGQNLQSVPIAVTAVTAAQLSTSGIRSTADLGTIAPAVTFAVGLGGAAVNIRGVGGTGSGSDEAANALYIDGVYMPSPQASLFQFNNIERVEILKGPQGTLFGRNASGGLIQVITPDPSHDPEASLELGYSNYDSIHAAGTVSGGLTDSLALSLTGVYDDQRGGWGRNYATNAAAYTGLSTAGRAKLVWQADGDTKVTGTVLYSFNRTAGIQGQQILPGERAFGGITNQGFYNQNENVPGYTRSKDTNYALTINHGLGWANLTSITSRDIVHFLLRTDADLSPTNLVAVTVVSPIKSWTQELQLASEKASRVQWLVGFFYFHSYLANLPFQTDGLAFAPLSYTQVNAAQRTNSYALYGQTTVPVTARTNITVGLRYTIDDRTADASTSTSNPAVAPTIFPVASTEDKKLTWRFAVDQKLADRILLYASYSRGFKSGLYNITNPGTAPVQPQTIDAYEVGIKSDLFDRRVRLNLSAFHYALSDVQLRAILPGNPTPIFYNAAKAQTNGAEAEAVFSITPRFTVQSNVAFLTGHYDTFNGAVFYRVNNTAPRFGLTLLPPGNASGNQTIYTPRWVTNLSGQYKVPTPAGSFTIAGTWTYNSGYYFDPQNRVSNPSYHLINSTLTWEPKQGLFARAYVNNLLKQKYYSTIAPSNFGDYYFPAAPRTYGVTVGAKF